MIIAKFGGTSVSTRERVETICQIVLKEKKRKPVIVVSAIRGITDLLVESLDASVKERKIILEKINKIHLELVKSVWKKNDTADIEAYVEKCLLQLEKLLAKKERTRAVADSIVCYGEMISSYIISKALASSGIPAKQVIASEIIVTDDNFGAADFLPKETVANFREKLQPLIDNGIVPVVTGFMGSTIDGQITTLGRGGSDYSASVLGYAVHADEIQIWTDVNGIFSSDPRYVKDAKELHNISYKEASELATFGAKVLHPRTIRPAMNSGIPVRVLNTLNPASEGTLITDKIVPAHHVAAIASKRNIVLLNLYSTDMLLSKGFLAHVFSIFAKHNISVSLVSVSEVSISVSLDNDDNLKEVVKELKTFNEVTISREFGMVSLVGEGIVGVRNILGDIFSLLDKSGITVKMISLGASDINISLVIKSSHVNKAVAVLHKQLI